MRVVCIAILSALPINAFAGVKTDLAFIDKRLRDCNATVPNARTAEDCAAEAFDAADKILDRVYTSFADRLKRHPSDDAGYPGEAKDHAKALARLEASQAAWIAFRDAECDLQGIEMLGGSGERLVIADCDYRMTRDRATSLDVLARDM